MKKANIKRLPLNYNSLDLFKFIMSIFVIAIHTHPLEYCNNSIITNFFEVFFKCAVPFFFLTSGYILSAKIREESMDNKIEIIKKSLFKIIKLYVLWSIL